MFDKLQKFMQMRQSELSTRINRSRFLFGDGDDSIDNANNIGTLSKSSFEDNGRVSEDDPDYYKFKLRNSGSLKFNFKNRGEESIRFSIVARRDRVVSVNGKRLFAEIDSDDKGKLNARLQAGIYYIRVETEDGDNERFSLKLKFKSNDND